MIRGEPTKKDSARYFQNNVRSNNGADPPAQRMISTIPATDSAKTKGTFDRLHTSVTLPWRRTPQRAMPSRRSYICAPCWICLEEGPDEAGEPLVRDCACRGDTSAGYHLSCVFAYVKRKIDEEVKRGLEHGPPMHDERGILVNSYTCCPNCTTPYMSNFATALFERVVELADNLPNAHYVRYDLLELEAHALFYTAENSETTTVDTDKMMTAFRKLEKLRVSVVCEPGKSASLANSFGYSSAFGVRVSENAKHLLHQGEMQSSEMHSNKKKRIMSTSMSTQWKFLMLRYNR